MATSTTCEFLQALTAAKNSIIAAWGGIAKVCKRFTKRRQKDESKCRVKKALTDLYKTTIQPAERAKAANNQNLVCYFRGVRNALAAVGIELGFNITNGEDFDK